MMHRASLSNPAPGSRRAGFTIIELMFVLIIAGILAALAIPSYRQGIANNKTKTAAQSMYVALLQARTEAMKYNGACDVFLSPVDTGNWNRGWYVVADDPDPDGDGSTSFCTLDPDPAAGDTFDITDLADPEAHVIAVFDVDADDPDDAADDTDDPTDDSADYLPDVTFSGAPVGDISFNRNGRVTSGAVSISICDNDNLGFKRTVSTSLNGLPEIKLDGSCP